MGQIIVTVQEKERKTQYTFVYTSSWHLEKIEEWIQGKGTDIHFSAEALSSGNNVTNHLTNLLKKYNIQQADEILSTAQQDDAVLYVYIVLQKDK